MNISKKYNMLYPPMVQRIFDEEKDLKAVKTRLHQLYGAYLRETSHKKTEALLSLINPAPEPQEEIPGQTQNPITAILALHASTRERLHYLSDLCRFIIECVGDIDSILDLGCGYNPFTLSWWPINKLSFYYAYDIDTRTAELLNSFFALMNLPQTAYCMDLALNTPAEKADLTLMYKLIPVLESQIPGRGYALACEINTRFLVITYPLKSLGGKMKGMERNYSNAFSKAYEEGLLEGMGLIGERRIGDELVYVLAKNEMLANGGNDK